LKKQKLPQSRLDDYKDDERFQDWYCYMEDRWLWNADLKEKLIGVFGSVEAAIEKYRAYIAEEAKYSADV
jgi:hypothetical protein